MSIYSVFPWASWSYKHIELLDEDIDYKLPSRCRLRVNIVVSVRDNDHTTVFEGLFLVCFASVPFR